MGSKRTRASATSLTAIVLVSAIATSLLSCTATRGRWSEGWYSEGDLDPKRGYLYIAIVYNLSILFAMLALVWFYVATKEFLA